MSTVPASDSHASPLPVGDRLGDEAALSPAHGLRTALILVVSGFLAVALVVWLSFGSMPSVQKHAAAATDAGETLD